LLGIAVGRADAKRYQSSGGQCHAAELDLRGGDAVAELVGAFKPQDFLDCALDQVRMFDQALLLRLVRRQRDQSVANQIGGGFVSGVEQKDAVVQQFLFAQPLAIVLALNEACQHVAFRIARFGPSPRHQNFEVAKEILDRFVAAGKRFC